MLINESKMEEWVPKGSSRQVEGRNTAKVYGEKYSFFCFFIPIVVEVECMDLHHSHYGNRFSIA